VATAEGGWVTLLARGRVAERGPDGRPLRVIGIHTDITEWRRIERERVRLELTLHQVQRADLLGQMAGSVAHDFNNLLSPILAYSELLLDSLPTGDSSRTRVGQIRSATLRGRDLVQQLLSFSRNSVPELRPLDLGAVLTRFETLLRSALREDIEFRQDWAQALPLVLADAGQMEQVVMNLVVNARDAMPRGGRLLISLRAVDAAPAPGPHLLLSVSDSGVGMDAGTLEHMFEPFFTTKERGKGTGLGLATVARIIEQHGGSIRVHSTLGEGTVVEIFLPVCDAPPGLVGTQAERGLPDPLLWAEARILLVEDDPFVRESTRQMIESLGFRVHVCGSPDEGIAFLERHGGPLDLLVTDVVLPGMNGHQLFERLQASRPGLRVLYMSGHAPEQVTRYGIQLDRAAFIQKPFASLDLRQMILELLG
jgi:two-component system, cell cycle sensor histidine kinase and response regulator CckA